MTRKRPRVVRKGAVGKVPVLGNSLAAYPTHAGADVDHRADFLYNGSGLSRGQDCRCAPGIVSMDAEGGL